MFVFQNRLYCIILEIYTKERRVKFLSRQPHIFSTEQFALQTVQTSPSLFLSEPQYGLKTNRLFRFRQYVAALHPCWLPDSRAQRPIRIQRYLYGKYNDKNECCCPSQSHAGSDPSGFNAYPQCAGRPKHHPGRILTSIYWIRPIHGTSPTVMLHGSPPKP